ncbi:MAG: hypothetical protein SGJ13_08845 [Actinomycetota bacterium]|nr:hypothetical protein [Actinomycetota bacterium]
MTEQAFNALGSGAGRSQEQVGQADNDARDEFRNINDSMEPSERAVPEDMRWEQAQNEGDSLAPGASNEEPSTFDDPSGDAWGETDEGGFDNRSPADLDPGFPNRATTTAASTRPIWTAGLLRIRPGKWTSTRAKSSRSRRTTMMLTSSESDPRSLRR